MGSRGRKTGDKEVTMIEEIWMPLFRGRLPACPRIPLDA